MVEFVNKGENTGIYIVNEDYEILYLNDAARSYYPNLELGMKCYEGICRETAPCKDCPCIGQDANHVMYYNAINREWLDVSSGKIEWSGHTKCKFIAFRLVDENTKNLFYNLTDKSVYDELYELNLANSHYKILFNQKDKYLTPELEGRIDAICDFSTRHTVHPDDKEQYLKFWDMGTLERRLKADNYSLKQEFRKKKVDGSYCWVSQLAVMLRKNENDDAVVMCFVQDISEQKLLEEEKLSASSKRQQEIDPMTGLYRYGPFFDKAQQVLTANPDQRFCMVAIDIEHFKLFNEWYGEEAGDQFLINIGKQLKALEETCISVAGYMGGDDFAIILPKDLEIIDRLEQNIREYVRQYGGNSGFLPAFGIYEIEDRNTTIGIMYDRATIALSKIKGNYTKRKGWYDAAMKQKMEDDQVLLSEVQHALENEEFIFYVQPQCNMLTGKIIGLESLVRWRHPVRGIVPPGVFIPLLEENGFITNLDLYVWERVCRRLHDWIQAGHRPIPISVNVSRMDIYSIDIAEVFTNLASKYSIDPSLLEIEITESAYAEDYNLIRKVVEDLRKAGFTVLMDDFGSGYSSLNMLKDVNVDVIKIDTKFLDMSMESQGRGMGILETIVRMARVMQLGVIAEGVEKIEQVNFLRNIGCVYGQGYYFYRPMPIEQAEILLGNEENIDYRGLLARQVQQVRLEDLFNENITSENIINSILGPIALYEVNDKSIELLKANEQYYRITGTTPVDLEERRKNILDRVHPDDVEYILGMFEDAYNNPMQHAEGNYRRFCLDGEFIWVHIHVFFLREQEDGRMLYYGSLSDITESVKNRHEIENVNRRLREKETELLALEAELMEYKNRLKEV